MGHGRARATFIGNGLGVHRNACRLPRLPFFPATHSAQQSNRTYLEEIYRLRLRSLASVDELIGGVSESRHVLLGRSVLACCNLHKQ